MSKGTRVPLGTAQTQSKHLVAMLQPFTEKIKVVGSVRRGKGMVGDVEICALAKETQLNDLFGQPIAVERTTLDDALDKLSDEDYQGWRLQPRGQGRKLRRLRHIHLGLACDLYIVLDQRAWGSHVVVRTGPRLFSKLVVTTALEMDYHFANGFLLHAHPKMRSPCPDGAACGRIIPLYEERAVFKHLEMSWLSPEYREELHGSGL